MSDLQSYCVLEFLEIPNKVRLGVTKSYFTSILVTWTYTYKDNEDKGKNFEVAYAPTNDGYGTKTITTTKSTVTVDNLKENTQYKICISASNAAGKGDANCVNLTTCKFHNAVNYFKT